MTLPFRLALVAVLAMVSCGGNGPSSPAPTPTSTVAPPVLVTPPPASSVVQLTAQDLLDLAGEHRIKSATIYDDAVTGTMVSDVSSGQEFSAARARGAPATAAVMKALTDGGASVTVKHGSKPA